MTTSIQLQLIDRALAKRSLAEFARQAFRILEPHTELVWNWQLDLICEYLEQVSAGAITRLVINCPPRFMKSLLVSVIWPVWTWTTHPETRWLFASYAKSLALKHSRDRRQLLFSDWFRSNFPEVHLSADDNTMAAFSNTAQGAMRATSVGGSVTGFGAETVVVDDLINPAQADSEAERMTSLRFYDESLSTRHNDKKTGRTVIVEQRTHLEDLTGHVVAQGGWVHLSLPAEFQRHTVFAFPRSGRQVVCKAGDILWPKREDRPQLEAANQRLGSYAYSSQYLQEPVPRGGALFREDWFHRTYREPPVHFDKKVMSLDTAFKTGDSADYSAVVVIGLLAEPDGTHEPGYYVLYAWHGRLPFNELKRFVSRLAAEFNPDEVLVEDAASGQSLIQELMADTVLSVKPIKVDSDKFSRASAVTPMFESGRVFFPEVAGWLSALTSELLAFPAAPHDDLVDALVHGLNHLRHFRDQAREWIKLVARQGTSRPTPGPSLRAYEQARLRAEEAERGCPVCLKPVLIIGGEKHLREGLTYYHSACYGKPLARAKPVA